MPPLFGPQINTDALRLRAHAKARRREDFLETAVLRRFMVDEPSRLIHGAWRAGISHRDHGEHRGFFGVRAACRRFIVDEPSRLIHCLPFTSCCSAAAYRSPFTSCCSAVARSSLLPSHYAQSPGHNNAAAAQQLPDPRESQMDYTLVLKPRAIKDLQKIPRHDAARILDALEQLQVVVYRIVHRREAYR